MSRSHRESEIPSIAPETEYLITDVEELVNQNVDKYLQGKTFELNIKNFMPETHEIRDKSHLPIGITRLDRNVVQRVAPGVREFTGMDMLFTYPLYASESENPLNISLNWSGGVSARLALVDNRPIVMVEKGEETLYAGEPTALAMQSYLDTIGLPASIEGDNFDDLMGDIYSSESIKLERSSAHMLDLGTTMEMKHTAYYAADEDGTKQLVQELLLNIDHTDEPRVSGIVLPGKSYRNLFRFERSDTADRWIYKGAYGGKLAAGEFIDKLVQENPKLNVPGAKLLEKAFYFLNQQDIPTQEQL